MVLVALAIVPLAAAQKDYTEVKLVVVDSEKGTPVPKAGITLHFVRGKNLFGKKEKAEWDLKTDSHGQVSVPFIPHGKMRVQIIAKGYQTYGEDFEIAGDEQTINVKLSHPSDQYSVHDTPAEKKP